MDPYRVCCVHSKTLRNVSFFKYNRITIIILHIKNINYKDLKKTQTLVAFGKISYFENFVK